MRYRLWSVVPFGSEAVGALLGRRERIGLVSSADLLLMNCQLPRAFSDYKHPNPQPQPASSDTSPPGGTGRAEPEAHLAPSGCLRSRNWGGWFGGRVGAAAWPVLGQPAQHVGEAVTPPVLR